MAAKPPLCQTLKITSGAGELTHLFCKLFSMLRCNVVLKRLTRGTLVITVFAFVLK